MALTEIIQLASLDSDPWILMVADILKSFPDTGSLNLDLEEQNPNVQDILGELREKGDVLFRFFFCFGWQICCCFFLKGNCVLLFIQWVNVRPLPCCPWSASTSIRMPSPCWLVHWLLPSNISSWSENQKVPHSEQSFYRNVSWSYAFFSYIFLTYRFS